MKLTYAMTTWPAEQVRLALLASLPFDWLCLWRQEPDGQWLLRLTDGQGQVRFEETYFDARILLFNACAALEQGEARHPLWSPHPHAVVAPRPLASTDPTPEDLDPAEVELVYARLT